MDLARAEGKKEEQRHLSIETSRFSIHVYLDPEEKTDSVTAMDYDDNYVVIHFGEELTFDEIEDVLSRDLEYNLPFINWALGDGEHDYEFEYGE